MIAHRDIILVAQQMIQEGRGALILLQAVAFEPTVRVDKGRKEAVLFPSQIDRLDHWEHYYFPFSLQLIRNVRKKEALKDACNSISNLTDWWDLPSKSGIRSLPCDRGADHFFEERVIYHSEE